MAKNSITPVYVICGKDKFLVGKSCSKLVDTLLPPDQRAMALYQPGDESFMLSDVLDELRTRPFLAERRVVLIKDADKFVSENRTGLEKYFDDPSPCGVLILTVDSWPGNTKLAKKLKSMGQLISDEVKPWEMSKFATEYAMSEYGKKLTAASLLVELAGDDPGRISGEIDKLALYAGDKNTIDAKDVEALVGHNRMFNVFAVIDAISAGNRAGAIERLRNMFAADRSAEFSAVGAFAYHYRKLFSARAMIEKGASPDEISRKLRLFGRNKNAFFAQVRKMSLPLLGSVISELARIDYGMKTGGTTGPAAIERLVIKQMSHV